MDIDYAKGDGPKYSDLAIIEKYAEKYGEDVTFKDLLALMKGPRQFRCPKCNGRGYVAKQYNAYPPGLPDSGWVDDWKLTDVECDLCGGQGWTDREWKPRMVQDGWESTTSTDKE